MIVALLSASFAASAADPRPALWAPSAVPAARGAAEVGASLWGTTSLGQGTLGPAIAGSVALSDKVLVQGALVGGTDLFSIGAAGGVAARVLAIDTQAVRIAPFLGVGVLHHAETHPGPYIAPGFAVDAGWERVRLDLAAGLPLPAAPDRWRGDALAVGAIAAFEAGLSASLDPEGVHTLRASLNALILPGLTYRHARDGWFAEASARAFPFFAGGLGQIEVGRSW